MQLFLNYKVKASISGKPKDSFIDGKIKKSEKI